MSLAACHTNPPPPAAAPHQSATDTEGDAAQGSAAGTAPLALSVAQLNLPLPPADASRGERQFYAAAIRAVRHIYEDDVDDPSQLLALQQRLGRDKQLEQARPIWQPVLLASLDRAAILQTLGPTLRALRQAVVNAWRDEAGRTYREVDMASCRIAQSHMPKEPNTAKAPLRDTVVTVEPLGAYTLRVLLRFCDDPKSLYDHE